MPTYRELILKMYNDRTTYDAEPQSQHACIAQKLVASTPLRPGDRVLDLATGTGLVAFAAAERIAPQGHVEAIDISDGLLQQARRKQAGSHLANIGFRLADAERTIFPQAHYDHVFCCEALVLFEDPLAALRKCHGLLRPQGSIAFTCTHQDSYFGNLLQEALTKVLGASAPRQMHEPLGTKDRIAAHLVSAGFKGMEIGSEDRGSYKAPASVRCSRDFITLLFKGSVSPANLPDAQLDRVCTLFHQRILDAATPQGVWQDTGLFFVHAARA